MVLFGSCSCHLTNQGLQDVLHALDELPVDLDDEVAQYLLVLRQLKVGETVFVLFAGVLLHDGLQCNIT